MERAALPLALARTPLCFIAMIPSVDSERGAQQFAAIEAANPCFRERHVESGGPGKLLAQVTFYFGHFKVVGKIYLHIVLDIYGWYTFGPLQLPKEPKCAVAVLRTRVQTHLLVGAEERRLGTAHGGAIQQKPPG